MAQLTLEERIKAAEFIRETYLPGPGIGSEPIPHLFVQDILGANTWYMQDEIVKSVFKYKTTAVKTCNAVGKSFIAARIVVSFLTLLPGSVVVTTAPTWRQVTDVLWREIAMTVKLSKYKLTDNEVRQAGLDIAKDWYAVGLSTKYPENFFGYHADHILVVVDEAGGVPEPIFKGVKAITPNANARILYIGNPTNPSGTFYDAFNNPKLPIKRFTISAFQSPNFTANGIRDVQDLLTLFTPPQDVDEMEHVAEVQAKLRYPYPALIDPATVYERYWEWGVDSPAWESLVMGEFPSQAEQALIPVDLVKMAMQMYGTDPDTGKTYADLSGWDIPTGPPEYGMDVARFGSDLNVLTPRRGGWTEEQIIWNKKGDAKLDTVYSADRIVEVIDPVDHTLRLNIDDTGVGGGVTDNLNRLQREAMNSGRPAHQYQLAAYNMASKEFMTEPNRFDDINSELYWKLRTWFYKKQIALHEDKKLFDELVGRRWGINKQNGKIQVEKKDDVKKRSGGRSPDRSDSLALAFSGGMRSGYTPLPQPHSDRVERREPTLRPITAGVTQRF
jgi:phage terminase large subunit